MKRKYYYFIIFGLIIILLVSFVLFDFNKNNEKTNLKKVSLAEVAHTIFYAPQYVAIEKGYFKDVGIDLDLILTPGADKVTAALLSGDVDIGFCGSEATIYVYNNGEKDYLKTFAQLTQKDGSFLVSRKKYKNFKLKDLKGKKIIGGRANGMPEMTLEYALKRNNIDPKKDVEIDTSVEFSAMSGAFIGGEGDFVTLFEPNASDIEKQGYGYVLLSVGDLGGIVPYTSYSSRSSYIKDNKETIINFNKAIEKGLNYVQTHSDKEIATVIKNQFPDSNIDDLTVAIKRYRDSNVWPKNTKFSKNSFNHLQDIMIDNKAINNKVPYNKLIYNF